MDVMMRATPSLLMLMFGFAGPMTACHAGDPGPAEEDFGDTATLLMGEPGEIEPTVSSVMIETGGETLMYLRSDSLPCLQLMVSRWLGSMAADTQVIEIVVPSDQAEGTVPIEEGAAEADFVVELRTARRCDRVGLARAARVWPRLREAESRENLSRPSRRSLNDLGHLPTGMGRGLDPCHAHAIVRHPPRCSRHR